MLTLPYRICHLTTGGFEGFYTSGLDAKSKDDPGKETILGLTRTAEPDSKVWPIVDRFKKLPGFPDNMRGNQELLDAAEETYAARYWVPWNMDGVKSLLIQAELFDAGVNIGIGWVSVYLRLCLNSFNKKATAWPDLALSPANLTPAAMSQVMAQVNAMCALKGGESQLYEALNAWQGIYYHIGAEGFKKLIEILQTLKPRDWAETFQWGWWGLRIMPEAQFRAELAVAEKKLTC